MRMNTQGKENYEDFQGNKPPIPGRYHLTVVDVDPTFEKGNFLGVTVGVVTGDHPDEKGRQLRERFWLTDDGEATDAICRLAMVLDLIGGDEEKEVNWHDAVGKSFVGAVSKRKGKDDKEYTNIDAYGLATWKIDHPDVEDVAVDRAFIADAQNKPSGGAQGGSTGSDGWEGGF